MPCPYVVEKPNLDGGETMATDEAREFLEQGQQHRGYTLEMHRIMAEVDLEWAKKYNQFIEAT